MKILVLGVTGMLGSTMLKYLTTHSEYEVYGAMRGVMTKDTQLSEFADKIITGVNIENQDLLAGILNDLRPAVIINCIGVVKQLPSVSDALHTIPLNAVMPHRLALLARMIGARLIHISTDCVFSGKKGNYTENDIADAEDLYGRSKLLGEVAYPHTVTLRTSIIGHELAGARSLIDWFLSQKDRVNGYVNAIYSGVPTVELAEIIAKYIIPDTAIAGIYHVASAPINKYALLQIVKEVYKKSIDIIPVEEPIIDRSLDASRFNTYTGYIPPEWPTLIRKMYEFR